MTIYELNKILTLKDWDKICVELERHGFRKAGEIGEWEYSPEEVHRSAYRKNAIQKDEVSGKEYYGTIYKNNKRFKGLTFVALVLFVILRDKNNLSVPRRALLFTDAPYNEKDVKKTKPK